ncbi:MULTISPECIES: hypothetical protein [Pseudomonas fluorescens group]|jgi:hypothetical protein|uniref:hypothetical protein n=1 Tax=Pseudomonas fluorescens group TaxID=136843 RepID=UPI00069826AE|nr:MULTISPECIES: hypothetical protein [Pseudomonas fluorescens group]MBI6617778.1 hypothetical protein [Pseudomonas corrugata]MBI6694516.1 hypothetical protein [Pseudomonas corrugata]
MSLQLVSTDEALKKLITQVENDALVTPSEFRGIKEKSDSETDSITDGAFRQGLADFQKAADEVAEQLQSLALAARKAKLGIPDKDPQANTEKERVKQSLKKAVEFQLAYIVLAYKSSLERL